MTRFATAPLIEFCHDENCGVKELCQRWTNRSGVDLQTRHYATLRPMWMVNSKPCPSAVGDFGDIDE
jgi:hypothetical protein